MSEKMNFISLFSGGGGMARGFIEAGFRPLVANDIEKEAENTHNLNWPNIPFIRKDIRVISESDLSEIIGGKKVSIIVGGPPCQGFTNMGDKVGADPRNSLVEAYIKIVSWIKPPCVLLENVPGMMTRYNKKFYHFLCDSLSALDYDVHSAVLNAADFGVPQIRKRLFIFGTKMDTAFNFRVPGNKSIGKLQARNTVGDAIMDLVGLENKAPNHIPLKHGEIVVERYRYIEEGGKLPAPELLPKKIRRKNFGNTYQRLHRQRPATTMVPGNNAFPVHPTLHRSLTPREAARLQSFPDAHIFTGTRAKQCILVGNAVPPLLAAHLAKQIKDHLSAKVIEISNNSLVLKRGEYFEKHQKTNIKLKENIQDSRTFVDLFSGAGGILEGFSSAGLECLCCADNDKYVKRAHKLNFPGVPFIDDDLGKKEAKEKILEKINGRKVDIVVGGPPCQGFSVFGERRLRKNRDRSYHFDERNKLVLIFWDYVKLINPDWVILENVPGLVSMGNGYFLKEIEKNAEKLGYNKHEWQILNAASFGVPQERKRFIFIATKTDLVIPWPKPKFYRNPKDWQKPYRPVAEVITDIADPSTYGRLPNHEPPKHHPIVEERFSYIKEGEKLVPSDLPEHLRLGIKTGEPVKNFSHVFKRLDRNKPSSTMVPGHNAFPVHPWLNRTLTIREVARIQTFSDEHIFVGPIINKGLQVGNAFPCLLAQMLAEILDRVIRNSWSEQTITKLAKYSMIRKA